MSKYGEIGRIFLQVDFNLFILAFFVYLAIFHFMISLFTMRFSYFHSNDSSYFQREKQKSGRKHGRRYVEGWVEFKRKSIAKQVAKYLNAMPVGGKRRSMARETLWTMKYLSGYRVFDFCIIQVYFRFYI